MKKKNLAYMMLGGCAVLAYQKYKKPMIKTMDKVASKMMKKEKNMLEDMM